MAEPEETNPLDEALDAAAVEDTDAHQASIDALVAERDELKDRMLRALADAENSRKRAAKDRQEAQAYGGTRIARDLLPVYDNLHRALLAAKEDEASTSTAIVEGVELTLKELMTVFDRHGVKAIEPQVGDKFDPQEHEAMFEAPVPGTSAGDIIQVSATGFMLHDRLLRPAQVGVSSTPASAAKSG